MTTNPHDGSYTIVHDPAAGQPRFDGARADYLRSGEAYRWPGPIEPIDSHDGDFEIIDPLGGRVDGEMPDNIRP